MAKIWAFSIALVLHFIFWAGVMLKTPTPDSQPPMLIEVSFITQSAPIKSKQNDNVAVENQPASNAASVEVAPKPPPIEPIKPVAKPIEKIIKKPIEPAKKETPKPKIITTEKSEIVVKKVEKPTPTPKSETIQKPIIEKAEKAEKIEKVEVKERPRLSLESVQQQISQIGSHINQQQVSLRDKYINEFGVKVKRIGQIIYDRGTLPAGILETKIEINAEGTLIDFKITRSSGSVKLDEAVENMIRSSAPYSDLPFQLLNESNTLKFTRVWEFYGD
ncbi:MAG: TonB C-terminal domain-containing protein [Methylococcaceae bacterium]